MTSTAHNNLKEARLRKGLSQAEVADQLHISRQAISRWENGKARPDIDNLRLLSKLYNVSVDQLLGISDSSAAEEISETSYGQTSSARRRWFPSLDRETIVCVVILVLSTRIAFLGFAASIIVANYLRRYRPRRKVCFLFAVGCCCCNLIIVAEWIYLLSPYGYSTTIEKISLLSLPPLAHADL